MTEARPLWLGGAIPRMLLARFVGGDRPSALRGVATQDDLRADCGSEQETTSGWCRLRRASDGMAYSVAGRNHLDIAWDMGYKSHVAVFCKEAFMTVVSIERYKTKTGQR